jgi:hypothetical protein
MDAGQKISGELIVTCCDSAKVLELVEEALDEVTLRNTGQSHGNGIARCRATA